MINDGQSAKLEIQSAQFSTRAVEAAVAALAQGNYRIASLKKPKSVVKQA